MCTWRKYSGLKLRFRPRISVVVLGLLTWMGGTAELHLWCFTAQRSKSCFHFTNTRGDEMRWDEMGLLSTLRTPSWRFVPFQPFGLFHPPPPPQVERWRLVNVSPSCEAQRFCAAASCLEVFGVVVWISVYWRMGKQQRQHGGIFTFSIKGLMFSCSDLVGGHLMRKRG